MLADVPSRNYSPTLPHMLMAVLLLFSNLMFWFAAVSEFLLKCCGVLIFYIMDCEKMSLC